MKSITKLLSVEIINLKNVKKGSFHTSVAFGQLEKPNVVGFYGQNGSGKTAIVEACNLLKILLSAKHNEALPKITDNLIYFNEPLMKLSFEFLVENIHGEYTIQYSASLRNGDKRLQVTEEELAYRENIKNKRRKKLIYKKDKDISIRNIALHDMKEEDRVTVMVANNMSKGNHTSFVFREELHSVFEDNLNEEEIEIVKSLSYHFNKDLHVIYNIQYGLLIANIIMPFDIHYEDKRGKIPYEMQDTMLLPLDIFNTLNNVVLQTNIVLQTIIPGLQIKVSPIHSQKMESGSEGIRFEFLSKRNEIELPLRSESEGILKIISILSTLIGVYNNPNACVVIDELDAGIFEYLLGELLELLSENGKGQLFFTSHNLRILEVLPTHNLWFTTMNESNRYLQLKGVKKLSNARDIYLRAVQLGGQEESIYAETNLFDIKSSFRKAGFTYEQE